MTINHVITGSNKINTNDGFKSLSINDEVISISNNGWIFNDHSMFKVKQLITKVEYMIQRYGDYDQKRLEKCFSEGVDCELLKFGEKKKKKGKVRVKLTVEFCPDEPEFEENHTNNQPESTLDDIRQMIN